MGDKNVGIDVGQAGGVAGGARVVLDAVIGYHARTINIVCLATKQGKRMADAREPGDTATGMGRFMGQSDGAYRDGPGPARTPGSGGPARPPGVPAAGRGTREKIPAADAIEEALRIAAITIRPDEVSGRQLIFRAMPQLYVMRQKGFSYTQLTRLLNEAITGRVGVARLQVSTVKGYYHEFLVERLDECNRFLVQATQAADQVKAATQMSPADLEREAMKYARSAAATRAGDGAARLLGLRESVPPGVGAAPRNAAPPQGGAAGGAAPPTAARENAGRPPTEAAAPPKAVVSPAAGEGDGQSVAGVAAAGGQRLVCLAQPTEFFKPEDTRENPQEYFSEAVLPHPSIPGLMLTKEQRMAKGRLRYLLNEEETLENVAQMTNRMKWRRPAAVTPSRTAKDFTPMDMSLFAKRPERK